MSRINARIDDDTKTMLNQLIDLDCGISGKSSDGVLLTKLIRKEHQERFPNDWKDGYYRHYKLDQRTA